MLFAAAMIAAVSCGSNARIEGELSDAPASEVIVKLLNINQYEVLDTLKTDAAGRFSYKVPVEKGQPEFVYVFYKDTPCLVSFGLILLRKDGSSDQPLFWASTRRVAPYISRSLGFSIFPVALRGTSAKMILRGRLYLGRA